MATNERKQYVPIFVSSTYKDLEAHRAKVEQCLVGLEQIVKGMEYWGSSPDKPLEVCLRKVSECKLMILIVGSSYGSIVPETQKSFTEFEYEVAVEKKIPVLVYLADMESTNIGIPLSGVDTEHVAELKEFKDRLQRDHMVSYFTSIDDLAQKVEHDVPETLKKLSSISVNTPNLDEKVTEERLRTGGYKFDQFWLRPSKYVGETVPIRLRINKKWGGWKVKDELIRALGLEVGDTISTEITNKFSKGIIDDDDDTDMFASGEGANWLLDNNVTVGTVVDCFVRFAYCKAPIGPNSRIIHTVSLVFVKGIRIVGIDSDYNPKERTDFTQLLRNLR